MIQPDSSQKDLAQKLAKYADKHAFFYVTLDPERALGIEDILPNYTIICPYKSPLTEKLKKEGIAIIVLEENMPEKEVEKTLERGTYGMLSSKFVQASIDGICAVSETPHKARIMVLKNSALIEELCKKQGWKLLAPKASVAEKFENKISQYKLLKNTAPYPKTILTTLNKLSVKRPSRADSNKSNKSRHPLLWCTSAPKQTSSFPFVLQFNRGHSGNTTFFIKSKKDIEKLYKLFPNREAKISQHIKGDTYTLNCLLLKNGEIITGSLSKQITGLKSATNNPNTTVGNDFGAANALSKKQVKKIQEIVEKVGSEMHQRGYGGLFGIDVIIDKEFGKVYFIELNTHQPASISFEAKLHWTIGKTPLLAYFIADALKKSFEVQTPPPIILPIKAKQIIYRNKTNKIIKATSVKNTGRLVSRMKFIKPNEELYRIQQYNSITI